MCFTAAMKTKAAIATAPTENRLEIETLVGSTDPRTARCWSRLKATGHCHTDEFTRSGTDPEGMFPAILGHEGAGIVLEVGPGVTSVKPGDHVIPLYTPECRQCKSCLSGKTNLCTAIRATQGKGVMPDGTSRFSLGGKPVHHYMGCSTFANHTVLPEIALAKIRPDAPFDKVCYIGCGVTTGIGAVVKTAKVEPGANVVVFGLGGIGLLNVIQARADGQRTENNRRRRQSAARGAGAQVRHDPFRQSAMWSAESRTISSRILVTLTDGGADYSFECIGNVAGDAAGARMLPSRLGPASRPSSASPA